MTHLEVLRMAELRRIGWKEYLDFPEWGLSRVRVKIDTGARTSALDVPDYELEETPEGAVVRLVLDLDEYSSRKMRKTPSARFVEVVAPVLRMATVSNTGGQVEVRPVVEAKIKLGPVKKRICLTLTNRSWMRHRMILGRQALAGSFVVDVGARYLLRRKKR
jgi:hypothetical protein